MITESKYNTEIAKIIDNEKLSDIEKVYARLALHDSIIPILFREIKHTKTSQLQDKKRMYMFSIETTWEWKEWIVNRVIPFIANGVEEAMQKLFENLEETKESLLNINFIYSEETHD